MDYHSNPKHIIQLEYQDHEYVQSSFPAHYKSYPDDQHSQQRQLNPFVENINEQYKLLKHNVQSRIKTLENNMREGDSIKTKNSLNNEATSQYLHNINTNKKTEKGNIPFSIYRNNSFMFQEYQSRNQNQQLRSRSSVQRGVHYCEGTHCCSHHFHCCRPIHCHGHTHEKLKQEKSRVIQREIRKLIAQQKDLKEETRKKLDNPINDNMSYPSNNSSNTVNLNEVMYENLQTQKQINRNLLLLNNKLLKYSQKGSLSIQQEKKEKTEEKQKFSKPFGDEGEVLVQYGQYHDARQKRRQEKNQYSRQNRKYESSDEQDEYDEENQKINQKEREYLTRDNERKLAKNETSIKKKYQLMKPHNLDRHFPNISQNNSKSISANKIQVKKKQKQFQEREKEGTRQRKIQMEKSRTKKKSQSSRNRSDSKNKGRKRQNENIQSEYFNENVGPKGLNINIKVKQQKSKRKLNGNCHLRRNQILSIYEIKAQRKRSRSNKNQIYKDSKHRNLKHERQHMLNALEQQDKLRNVIVEKMCKQFYNSFREK